MAPIEFIKANKTSIKNVDVMIDNNIPDIKSIDIEHDSSKFMVAILLTWSIPPVAAPDFRSTNSVSYSLHYDSDSMNEFKNKCIPKERDDFVQQFKVSIKAEQFVEITNERLIADLTRHKTMTFNQLPNFN
jgi:hypothetical protein